MSVVSEIRPQGRDYRLFGGLYLEQPEDHLELQELERLRTLEPLIRQMKSQQQEHLFDIAKEFSNFSQRETTIWKDLGAERPSDFLLHPSGDISSPIACHLHNPTFYVKDPYCQETDNESSPTIQQLHQAGFSSKNCFFFDHICRRDRTDDVLLLYNDEILRVHEDFMLTLRKAMAAKVEICWGSHVRERMRKLINLNPLRLWGEYRDVELHLEMQDESVLRFVLFAVHPQFFFYHGSSTESGLRFRETHARKQDLLLAVASKLSGVEITQNFYETVHWPARYGQFDKISRSVVLELEADADAQLRAAFPGKYEEIQSATRLLTEELEMRNLESAKSDFQELTLSQMIEGGAREEFVRRHARFAELDLTLVEALERACLNTASSRCMIQGGLMSDAPSEWGEMTEWDRLPGPLLSWIQNQDGLKKDRKPISSAEDLIAAYCFLSTADSSLHELNLHQIALKLAVLYVSKVKKRRHSSVQDLITLGVQPYNIMARKCAKCGARVLDDAFACFAKADPRKYVVWYRRHGCGRPNCRSAAGSASLVPLDPNHGYRMATRQSLQCLRTAGWEQYLLRCTPQEMQDVQEVVQTVCNSCRTQIFEDTKPRWTSESRCRYVITVRGCKTCNKRYCSFVPTNTSISAITKAALSKKWSDLRAGGIEPTEYPRRPDILWSRKSNLTKLQELEYARDISMSIPDEEVKLPPSLRKKRNFNNKNRMKP